MNCKKKKKNASQQFYKKMNNLHNILTNFLKELTKYKNDYQQFFNYIYRNYIMHNIVYF